MYLKEDLTKFVFFNEVLKNNKIEYVLDSLTGLINRKYILEFVKYLISKNYPFSLAILDLDYFKNINDKNGHSTGDFILESIGTDLIKYVNGKGIAGRIGGDEFLIITLGQLTYDELHDFYNGIFHYDNVLRKRYVSDSYDIFITGTLGSASFPKDATSYEDLFSMADKTLYRGKDKGRNCYIIYVEKKHKDLQIQKMYTDDEPTILFNINSIFESNNTFNDKLIEVSSYIRKTLKIEYIFYIDSKKDLYDTSDMSVIAHDIDISDVKYNNELHKTDYRKEVRQMKFGDALFPYDLASTLTTRIKFGEKIYGYITFAQKRTAKIWINEELAILMYLSKIMTLSLESK